VIPIRGFHLQLGVRTFIGSIGPVQNVRMMVRCSALQYDASDGWLILPRRLAQMKSGHRACYMSRAFAQQNNFIPKDAAPGFYRFSGITNLGTWPITVRRFTLPALRTVLTCV
jgi:hypothetical protein